MQINEDLLWYIQVLLETGEIIHQCMIAMSWTFSVATFWEFKMPLKIARALPDGDGAGIH